MERIDFRDQISDNKRKSFFLLASIILVIILFGFLIGKIMGEGWFFIILIFSIIISLIYTITGYYYSDKIALASVNAQPASRDKYKQYYGSVEALTLASGLPMPRLYIMESEQINAFASGRDPKNAVICVTTGALKKLNKSELEGVLAHELSHISNFDIRYMTIATVLVGMVSIISELFLRTLWIKSDNDKGKAVFIVIGIILAILAPIIVQLVQLSISRKREFTADATAVKFTRYPRGLIEALKKIKNENIPEKKVSKAMSPLFFSNPVKNILSTHPPIEQRINVLEKM